MESFENNASRSSWLDDDDDEDFDLNEHVPLEEDDEDDDEDLSDVDIPVAPSSPNIPPTSSPLIASRTRANFSLQDKSLDDLGADESVLNCSILNKPVDGSGGGDDGIIEEDDKVYLQFLQNQDLFDDMFDAEDEYVPEPEPKKLRSHHFANRKEEEEVIASRTRAHVSYSNKKVEELEANEDVLNMLVNDIDPVPLVPLNETEELYTAFVRETLLNEDSSSPIHPCFRAPQRSSSSTSSIGGPPSADKQKFPTGSVVHAANTKITIPTKGGKTEPGFPFTEEHVKRLGKLLDGLTEVLTKQGDESMIEEFGSFIEKMQLKTKDVVEGLNPFKGDCVKQLPSYVKADEFEKRRMVKSRFGGAFDLPPAPIEITKYTNFTDAENELFLRGLNRYDISFKAIAMNLLATKNEVNLSTLLKNKVRLAQAPTASESIKTVLRLSSESRRNVRGGYLYAFSLEERDRLANGIAKYGCQWGEIVRNYLPHRGGRALKLYYFSLRKEAGIKASGKNVYSGEKQIKEHLKWTRDQDKKILEMCDKAKGKIELKKMWPVLKRELRLQHTPVLYFKLRYDQLRVILYLKQDLANVEYHHHHNR